MAPGLRLPLGGNFFRDHLGLGKQQQIVAPSGFGIGPGHIEPAEGMCADHRAGALAVEIKIAHVEARARFLQALPF